MNDVPRKSAQAKRISRIANAVPRRLRELRAANIKRANVHYASTEKLEALSAAIRDKLGR